MRGEGGEEEGPGVGRERGRERKMKGRRKKKGERRKREEGFIAYDCECVDAFNALRRGKDDPLSSGWLSSSKKSKAPRQITINRR